MGVCRLIGSTVFLVLALGANVSRADGGEPWITTWAVAPDQSGPVVQNTTIRQIVRASAAGSGLRLRLSNLYGTGPIHFAAVHVARRATGATIESRTDHVVTFNGQRTLTIAKGASALSDPVDMSVAALQELAVSLYLPAQAGRSTLHGVGNDNTYVLAGVDACTAVELKSARLTGSYYFLTDVEVARQGATIMAVGDSIADGVGSTTNDRGWVEVLAARLQALPDKSSIAVANAGIAGNRILQDASDPFRGDSALSRFDRDALSKPGVRWVILEMGMNDIGAANLLGTPSSQASAQQIILGLKKLIAFAHVKGIKIIGATLMPSAGADLGDVKHPYFSTAGEAKRQEVNAWIRNANAFDAVVDFDQRMRDPLRPDHLAPAFDSGDHLHPNDAGHKAMAEAVDLMWFD